MLNEIGLNSKLKSNSIIESGGIVLFVSGKKLIIANGAIISVLYWAEGKKTTTAYLMVSSYFRGLEGYLSYVAVTLYIIIRKLKSIKFYTELDLVIYINDDQRYHIFNV